MLKVPKAITEIDIHKSPSKDDINTCIMFYEEVLAHILCSIRDTYLTLNIVSMSKFGFYGNLSVEENMDNIKEIDVICLNDSKICIDVIHDFNNVPFYFDPNEEFPYETVKKYLLKLHY